MSQSFMMPAGYCDVAANYDVTEYCDIVAYYDVTEYCDVAVYYDVRVL